jgi:hypothetical protein
MGYILVTRNPRTHKLVIVTGDDDETVAEFATESEATAVAMAVPVCEAWGYEAVEVNLL